MPRIEVDLPQDLRAKAEARASEFGYRDVEEYIESLILADVNETSDDLSTSGEPDVQHP